MTLLLLTGNRERNRRGGGGISCGGGLGPSCRKRGKHHLDAHIRKEKWLFREESSYSNSAKQSTEGRGFSYFAERKKEEQGRSDQGRRPGCRARNEQGGLFLRGRDLPEE